MELNFIFRKVSSVLFSWFFVQRLLKVCGL